MARRKRQPIKFGFNDDPHSYTPQTVRKAKRAGANVVRMPLDVDIIRQHGLQPYEEAFKAARGVKVLPFIAGAGASDVREVKKISRTVAKRYGKKLAGVQVWNEPNLIGAMKPGKYAQMLKASERAVHKTRPKLDVISAAASPGVEGHKQYMKKVFSRIGDKRDIDVGVHIYPSGKPKKAVKKAVRTARRVSGGRDVWATEVGAAATNYPNQAKGTKKLYKALSKSGVKGAVFHRLTQPAAGSSGWEDQVQLGALSAEGAETPIYRALRQARMRDQRRRKR